MSLPWFVATLHLLALGIGMGAIFARAYSLQSIQTSPRLRTIFLADNLWALAGALWITTGLWRWLAGMENSTGYYLQNGLFHAKLGLVVGILLLEIWPMITLFKWRRANRAFEDVDLARAGQLAVISYVELAMVAVVLVLATAIARGVGA